jgi:hypothetical protein
MSDERKNNINHNSDSFPATNNPFTTNPLGPSPDSSVTTFSGAYALCVDIVMETVGSNGGSVEMSTQSYTDSMRLKNEPIYGVESDAPGSVTPSLLYDIFDHFGLLDEYSIGDMSLLVKHPTGQSHIRVEADDSLRDTETIVVPEGSIPSTLARKPSPRVNMLALDPTHQSSQWL